MKVRLLSALPLLLTTQLAAQQTDIGPPLGRLVDIGGRKLHLNCTGTGTPTVLLGAGASSFAIDWFLVQSEAAMNNRGCSYDRAGSGWSQPRPDVETPRRVVTDLHALLRAAGEEPPFVMIGASFGALYVRVYQLDYPEDVVGLVLVDPATEDRLFTRFEGRGVLIGSLTPEQLRRHLPGRDHSLVGGWGIGGRPHEHQLLYRRPVHSATARRDVGWSRRLQGARRLLLVRSHPSERPPIALTQP